MKTLLLLMGLVLLVQSYSPEGAERRNNKASQEYPKKIPPAAASHWLAIAEIDKQIVTAKADTRKIDEQAQNLMKLLSLKYPYVNDSSRNRTAEGKAFSVVQAQQRAAEDRLRLLLAARAERVAVLHRLGIQQIPDPLILKPNKALPGTTAAPVAPPQK